MERFLIAFLILMSAVAMRIVTYDEVKLPKEKAIKLEANIKREVRITANNQIIYIGDAKVYTDLYPRYRVGERIAIEGIIDKKGRMFTPRITKISSNSSIVSWRSELRNKIAGNIQGMLPSREATLIVGTVLGIDTISEDFKKDLVKTGTLHVVVVSGQNMMIVVGIFMSFAKYIGRRYSLILAMAAIAFYSFIAGFEPPVVRAGLMAAFASWALFFGREVNTVISLILAASLILIVWPSAIYEISFQLTFAATLGIITLGSYLQRKWSHVPVFGQNAAVCISAYLFTSPLLFWHFSQFNLIAPFANILVSAVIFPIMIVGFIVSALSQVYLPLAVIFAYIGFVFAYFFVRVVSIFSSLNLTNIQVLFLYLVLFPPAILWIRKQK